jgi:uncharacterized ferredoxin-like protein
MFFKIHNRHILIMSSSVLMLAMICIDHRISYEVGKGAQQITKIHSLKSHKIE